MHFLVADVAVLEARIAKIMERRGRRADSAVRRQSGRRQIAVTLETEKPDFRARQHLRVLRAVWQMACRATFYFYGRMFEREGSAQVAVAAVATRVVRIDGLDHARSHRPVRVVAVNAVHRAFGQTVVIGFLEAGPDGLMAIRALRIDGGVCARDQTVWSVFVDGVAGNAAHLVLDVAAVDAAYVRGRVQVAREADLIGFGGAQLAGVANIRGVHALGVLAPGAVAGFAGLCGALVFFVGLDEVVRILRESLRNILVASGARVASDVLSRFVLWRFCIRRLGILRGRRENAQQQHGCREGQLLRVAQAQPPTPRSHNGFHNR